MTEEFLLGRRKFVIAPVTKIRIESNWKQFQIARKAQVNSLNLLVFEGVPTLPNYAPLPYNIGQYKQANSKHATIDNVSRRSAVHIIDPVTDFHPRKGTVMQNEGISKKSACTWPEAWQNVLQALSILLNPPLPSLECSISSRPLEGNPKLWCKVFHR